KRRKWSMGKKAPGSWDGATRTANTTLRNTQARAGGSSRKSRPLSAPTKPIPDRGAKPLPAKQPNRPSPEEGRDGRALVGERNGAGAVVEILARIDSQRRVDRGVEIGDGDGILDDRFRQFVGD